MGGYGDVKLLRDDGLRLDGRKLLLQMAQQW